MTVLKLVIGQKLRGVIEKADGTIELHFEDFVILTRETYVSPIIERNV